MRATEERAESESRCLRLMSVLRDDGFHFTMDHQFPACYYVWYACDNCATEVRVATITWHLRLAWGHVRWHVIVDRHSGTVDQHLRLEDVKRLRRLLRQFLLAARIEGVEVTTRDERVGA